MLRPCINRISCASGKHSLPYISCIESYYVWNTQVTFPEISICPIKSVGESAITIQENINWLMTQLPKIRQIWPNFLRTHLTFLQHMLMVGHWHQYEECREESARQHTAKGCTLKAVVKAHLQVLIEIFYFKHFNTPKCCSMSGREYWLWYYNLLACLGNRRGNADI